MNLRTIASLAVAVFFGIIAVLLVRGVLSSQHPAGATASAGMTPVVVAAVPVERGVKLTPTMLKLVNYPKDSLPNGAVTSLDSLVGKNAAPRTTQRSLEINEPVLLSKLTGPGSKMNLSGVIGEGMRAVSVRSTDVSGVSGFVLPGDRVDVFLTRQLGTGEAANTVTQALVENALVLGVDQTADENQDKPLLAKTITIEATPEQAQQISLGESLGQISLALRQSADHAPLTRQAITTADLGSFGPRKPTPARAAAPAKPRPPSDLIEVHVVRGIETSAYSVGSAQP